MTPATEWGNLAYRRFGFVCTGFETFVKEIQADALHHAAMFVEGTGGPKSILVGHDLHTEAELLTDPDPEKLRKQA